VSQAVKHPIHLQLVQVLAILEDALEGDDREDAVVEAKILNRSPIIMEKLSNILESSVQLVEMVIRTLGVHDQCHLTKLLEV